MSDTIGPIVTTTPITLENFDDVGNAVVLTDFITSSGGVPDFALITNHSTTIPVSALVCSLSFITTYSNAASLIMPGQSTLQPVNIEEFDGSTLPYFVAASLTGNANISVVGVTTKP